MDSSKDQHTGTGGDGQQPRRITVQPGGPRDAAPAPSRRIGVTGERAVPPGIGAPRRPQAARPLSPPVRPLQTPARAAAPPAPQHAGAGKGSGGSSPARKYIFIGAGAMVFVLAALIAAGTLAVKCPGPAKLRGVKQGETLKGPFTLSLVLENRRCVADVSYQIDGVEVASESAYPYEVTLNSQTLSQKLPEQETHELTVSIEDTKGQTIPLLEKRTISFAAEERAPSPAASPSAEASPAAADDARAGELRAMCNQLASQISGKSSYDFSPEFTALVEQKIGEYRGVPASKLAAPYRRDVNKAFGDEGVKTLVGYVLAFSRSKFDPEAAGEGVGLWQIPPAVARDANYLSPGEPDSALKDPKRSPQIAVAYTKYLLDSFDTEDFMYAVACFGMNVNEAGRVARKLNDAAPDPASRRDIMKMLKAGVVTEAQVDRVARFFAAGIVGEHPQAFGQRDAQPISSLYY